MCCARPSARLARSMLALCPRPLPLRLPAALCGSSAVPCCRNACKPACLARACLQIQSSALRGEVF